VDLRGAPAGWAVVLESLVPGWKAWVDGRREPILPAQVAFQAVRFPDGARDLRLVYRPTSFFVGMVLSFVVTGLLIYGLAFRHRGGFLDQRIFAVVPLRRESGRPCAPGRSEPTPGRAKGHRGRRRPGRTR
jgi:hypothetical protein